MTGAGGAESLARGGAHGGPFHCAAAHRDWRRARPPTGSTGQSPPAASAYAAVRAASHRRTTSRRGTRGPAVAWVRLVVARRGARRGDLGAVQPVRGAVAELAAAHGGRGASPGLAFRALARSAVRSERSVGTAPFTKARLPDASERTTA